MTTTPQEPQPQPEIVPSGDPATAPQPIPTDPHLDPQTQPAPPNEG